MQAANVWFRWRREEGRSKKMDLARIEVSLVWQGCFFDDSKSILSQAVTWLNARQYFAVEY